MNKTLKLLFKGIGKEVFIKYFDLFSNPELKITDIIKHLPKKYTEKSKNSRTYKARKIFSENLEIEALKEITSSKRLSYETIQLAKELIQKRKDKLFDTDRAIDIFSESNRIQTTINRIIRDTKTTNALKSKYEYRCQFTGGRLEIGNNRYYVECHHIVPLGKPHNGQDIEENILCVSPDYHALLDYLAIPIKKEQLKLLKHQINDEFIEYHNNLVKQKSTTSQCIGMRTSSGE